MHKSPYRIAAVSFLAAASVAFVALSSTTRHGAFGTGDFVQYWSACRVAADGGSPYSARSQFELQRSVGLEWHQPVMLWAPPVLLGAMCLLLPTDFSAATRTWSMVNAWLAGLSIVFAYRATGGRVSTRPAVLATILFYPLADCMASGQVGIFLLFALSAAAALRASGYRFASGLVSAALLVKPHLFLPLFVYWLIGWWKRREVKEVAGICLGLAALTVLVPGDPASAWLSWWDLTRHGPDIPVTTPSEWRSNVMAADSKALLMELGFAAGWLTVAMPVLGALLGVGYAVRTGARPSARAAALLSAIGLSTAPYGWMSDFAVLFYPYAAMSVSLERKLSPIRLTLGLMTIQLLLMLTHTKGFVSWFPLCVGVAMFLWGTGNEDDGTDLARPAP